MSKTGGGPGSNQYGPRGVSTAAARRASRRPSPPSGNAHARTLRWDQYTPARPAAPAGDAARSLARYQASMPAWVFSDASLEGNSFTLPDVESVMSGDTPVGKDQFDSHQVLDLAEAARTMAEVAAHGPVVPGRPLADMYNAVLARHEVIEPGIFRGEGRVGGGGVVNAGGTLFDAPAPGPGGAALRELFDTGAAQINAIGDTPVRAVSWAAFVAYNQFYFDANKRTGRFVMNTVLLSHGHDAILIPGRLKHEYNAALVAMFTEHDPLPYMEFLLAQTM